MANKNKMTAQQAIEAIPGSGGIKSAIAKRLGVHRHTVDRYLSIWPTFKMAYFDECESVCDMGETRIIQLMNDGDRAAIMWYLARKRRAEFGENLDLTSKGEALKVILNVVYDDEKPESHE